MAGGAAAAHRRRLPATHRLAYAHAEDRRLSEHQTPPKMLPKAIREAAPSDKKNVYYDDLPEQARDELWEMFQAAVEPLRAAGKLGSVLFQFPPWFTYGKQHLDHILTCADKL